MVGWGGEPRRYGPIEEINLLDFDFDAYVAMRNQDSQPGRNSNHINGAKADRT
jgi:hypothetical protein